MGMEIRTRILAAVLFYISFVGNLSKELKRHQRIARGWRKSFIYLFKENRSGRYNDLKKQNIVASTIQPAKLTSITKHKIGSNAISLTTERPLVTAAKVQLVSMAVQPVTPLKTSEASPVVKPTITAAVKNNHAAVAEPIDVIPVQDVPPQRFLSLPTPTSPSTGGKSANQLSRAGWMLPNLPVYNVPGKNEVVKPVIPVREVSGQVQISAETNPVEPLPVMTRPTVTTLQRVIGTAPTQATLQSVVVPKRKHASPPSPLTPLPVLEPHTVAIPMKLLRPLSPLPPQEPHTVHHIPILMPKECNEPCGCTTNCSGK